MATLRQVWISGKSAAEDKFKGFADDDKAKMKTLLKSFDSALGPELDKLERLDSKTGNSQAQKVLVIVAKYRKQIKAEGVISTDLNLSLEKIEDDVKKKFGT